MTNAGVPSRRLGWCHLGLTLTGHRLRESDPSSGWWRKTCLITRSLRRMQRDEGRAFCLKAHEAIPSLTPASRQALSRARGQPVLCVHSKKLILTAAMLWRATWQIASSIPTTALQGSLRAPRFPGRAGIAASPALQVSKQVRARCARDTTPQRRMWGPKRPRVWPSAGRGLLTAHGPGWGTVRARDLGTAFQTGPASREAQTCTCISFLR